jgi:hypothetical protein
MASWICCGIRRLQGLKPSSFSTLYGPTKVVPDTKQMAATLHAKHWLLLPVIAKNIIWAGLREHSPRVQAHAPSSALQVLCIGRGSDRQNKDRKQYL